MTTYENIVRCLYARCRGDLHDVPLESDGNPTDLWWSRLCGALKFDGFNASIITKEESTNEDTLEWETIAIPSYILVPNDPGYVIEWQRDLQHVRLRQLS